MTTVSTSRPQLPPSARKYLFFLPPRQPRHLVGSPLQDQANVGERCDPHGLRGCHHGRVQGKLCRRSRGDEGLESSVCRDVSRCLLYFSSSRVMSPLLFCRVPTLDLSPPIISRKTVAASPMPVPPAAVSAQASLNPTGRPNQPKKRLFFLTLFVCLLGSIFVSTFVSAVDRRGASDGVPRLARLRP